MDETTLPLRDLHLPEPISWWPPAPGWWVLALLVVLGIIALFVWYRRYQQIPKLRKAALDELAAIAQRHALSSDSENTLHELSALLRRTAMSYTGRESSAGIHGQEWKNVLQKLAGREFDFDTGAGAALVAGPYAPVIDTDGNQMIEFCREYLTNLPARRSA